MQRLGSLALAAVLGLASCGYSTYYPHPVGFTDDTGALPEQVPCGFASGTPVSLTLTSSVAVPQTVWEVEPVSCSEQFRSELLPGGVVEFGTSAGVTWVSRGSASELLGYFTVPDGAEWTEAVP